MDAEPSEIMTPTEVMELLKVKRTTLYELIDLGLPFHSISVKGNTKRFLRSEVLAWFDSRKIVRSPMPPQTGRPRQGGRPTKSESAAVTQYKWIK